MRIDENNDGIQHAGETPVEGVVVNSLDVKEVTQCSMTITTTTDANGDVEPGEYICRVRSRQAPCGLPNSCLLELIGLVGTDLPFPSMGATAPLVPAFTRLAQKAAVCRKC